MKRYSVEEYRKACEQNTRRTRISASRTKNTITAGIVLILVAIVLFFNAGYLAQQSYIHGFSAGRQVSQQAAYDEGYEKGYASATYDNEA